MKITDWIKKQITAFALATSSVEKNALNQNSEIVGMGESYEQNKKKGTLSDALLRGELTQEVKDLRWRTYKVMQASEKLNYKFDMARESEDEDVETDTTTLFSKGIISEKNQSEIKIKVDDVDSYKVKLVVQNDKIVTGMLDATSNLKNGGNILNDDNDYPINIEREFVPKFNIEKISKKLIVREITNEKMLLEFYVSSYKNEDNKSSIFVINELNRLMNQPNPIANVLNFDKVSFITNKTYGSPDFRLYVYDNIKFDKIIKYDGSFVIKFFANVEIDGENIFDKYIEEELEEKYKNKVSKN